MYFGSVRNTISPVWGLRRQFRSTSPGGPCTWILLVSLVNYSCGCEFRSLNPVCNMPLFFFSPLFCFPAFLLSRWFCAVVLSNRNRSCVLWLSIPMWVLSDMSCRVQSHWTHGGPSPEGTALSRCTFISCTSYSSWTQRNTSENDGIQTNRYNRRFTRHFNSSGDRPDCLEHLKSSVTTSTKAQAS